MKPSISISPTPNTGASKLPPIGDSFMYLEISSNNHGVIAFRSFERPDKIQISFFTFYYNQFSPRNSKSMRRCRIQFLLKDNAWGTRYIIPKNDRCSNSSTEWTLLSLNYKLNNFGTELIYEKFDSPVADMCFSDIISTYSVY